MFPKAKQHPHKQARVTAQGNRTGESDIWSLNRIETQSSSRTQNSSLTRAFATLIDRIKYYERDSTTK